jgi:hypothetical protein
MKASPPSFVPYREGKLTVKQLRQLLPYRAKRLTRTSVSDWVLSLTPFFQVFPEFDIIEYFTVENDPVPA